MTAAMTISAMTAVILSPYPILLSNFIKYMSIVLTRLHCSSSRLGLANYSNDEFRTLG